VTCFESLTLFYRKQGRDDDAERLADEARLFSQ
jgi:hypothetical protein